VPPSQVLLRRGVVPVHRIVRVHHRTSGLLADGWRSSPPEEEGLDPKMLSQIDYDVKETFPAVKGVLVVRNGYVVFENYYQPDDGPSLSSGSSVGLSANLRKPDAASGLEDRIGKGHFALRVGFVGLG
jgi:hypothetical protein